MLPSKLLRFKDLTCVGIRNWPTLKRRVEQDNFPPGRYVGPNTRVWTTEEVERWWATRPSAAPPEINEPAAASPGREVSNGRDTQAPKQHPSDTDSVASVQALPNREGER
jgi:predicted DNA-binding transcriptional regulator AlpA